MAPIRLFIRQKMYLLLVLLIIIGFIQPQLLDPAYMAKWKSNKEACAKEEGVDLDDIAKAWKENHFPNDPKFKCFYKCVHLKVGILDAAGEVVDEKLAEVAVQLHNADTGKEIVEECGPIRGADLCETAYKLMACVKAAQLD